MMWKGSETGKLTKRHFKIRPPTQHTCTHFSAEGYYIGNWRVSPKTEGKGFSFLRVLRKPSIIQNVSKNRSIFLAPTVGDRITVLISSESIQDANRKEGFSIYVLEYSVLWQINPPLETFSAAPAGFLPPSTTNGLWALVDEVQLLNELEFSQFGKMREIKTTYGLA